MRPDLGRRVGREKADYATLLGDRIAMEYYYILLLLVSSV